MARSRYKGNKDVPANLYRDNGNSWRYRHPLTGKFHSMGTDKNKAFQAARKLNSILIQEEDIIAKVTGKIVTFKDFSEKYLLEKRRKDGRPIAENTKSAYQIHLNKLYRSWGEKPIDSITLKMVNEYLDEQTPSNSKSIRSLLCNIFDVAVSKGLCPDNPARITLRRYVPKQRKRHTIEGLQTIRDHSPLWLQNAIDLSMLTTQRRTDIVSLRWTDIFDGYIHIAQQKTTDDPMDDFEVMAGAGYVRIKIDSELQTVLDRCKSDKIISPFVIHQIPKRKTKNPNKEHWTQVLPLYLSEEFLRIVKESNAYPDLKGRQIPTFHEIRALAIFLHKKAGRSAQALAGHASAKMTEHYEAGHEIIWNDVDVGIALPFAKVT
ncbi:MULTISPECIES: phage integrase Arm DNA-binding domain-containing protein [Acinetobacter]|uniref:phage integrase Arm DNA-binding domain-containing protein n=1 Tax=Acinetobacter TaxID=469 RepID=UPI00101EBBD5|nr:MULTISPECIES: phage integrase Arm DNA-binding domain-containing protein [Acinetobacter]MDM1757159.1 phage integrase Arm DNA-binding domain-containing protein [Acinetobacter sp. 256-1]MDM1760058.1 phage integrase Arm DNA-binding domain-containing protein [Acinetobacter sp. 251-1]RYL27177.1 integrase [Acinetobacter piscicola]